MKKILFLIHDLGEGGAEKVLVNLVNNMDHSKYDITVMTLFDIGVNKQFLKKEIHYKTVFSVMFRGNSHLLKLGSPELLHSILIKDHYDIEVSYLEGPCARIISGCKDARTKIVTWIHREQFNSKIACASFRSKKEAERCYNRFNKIVCVSESVKQDFQKCVQVSVPIEVLYNTNESTRILEMSCEKITDIVFDPGTIKLVGVGKLLKNKGFDRLLRIVKRLTEENMCVHAYILGIGPEEEQLKKYISDAGISNRVSLLGYQTNPYKYVKNCDLFVCTSFAEGFSTAATEALIVGTPVCTVEVAGMREMLGERCEYGIITDNNEEALYSELRSLISEPAKLSFYKKQARIRGKFFSTEKTVANVQSMFESI